MGGFVQSIFKPPKPKGPSAAEIQARQQQQAQLAEQQKTANLEADRARRQRISKQRASRSGALGRSSLIKTTELGAKENLG